MNKFELIKRRPMRRMRAQSMNFHALIFCIAIALSNDVYAAEFDADLLPEFDCVIEPSEIVDLGTAVPGVIGAIYAERSDSVAKGDIVAELESSVEIATLKLSKARAQLDTSIRLRKESAAFGRRTHERNEVLFRKSSISEQAIDKLETENRIAQLQVHQERDNKNIAILEYQRAKVILDRHLIRTPFEGVVMERFKSVGEYIEDDPVLRIARLDPLNVEVILPVEYMGRLALGLRAEVTPGLPGFAGHIATVTLVDKVADAASGTFGVRLSLPNPGHAIPSGLRCRLAFLSPEEALNMPMNAAIPASVHGELENEEGRPLEFEKTARAALESEQFPDNLAAIQTPGTVINAERSANLTRILPNSEEAVLVVGRSDHFPGHGEATPTGKAQEPDDFKSTDSGSETDDTYLDQSYAENVSVNVSPNVCYRVGPFANEVLASRLLDAVSDMDTIAESSVDIELSQGPSAYLVLTSNLTGNRTPQELEEHLVESGVEDIFRLRSGQHKGRISLGYYRKEIHATIWRDDLSSMGIDAEVVEINRDLSTAWVNLSLDKNPDSRIELQVAATAFAPGASVQLTPCRQEHIAQSDKNNI